MVRETFVNQVTVGVMIDYLTLSYVGWLLVVNSVCPCLLTSDLGVVCVCVCVCGYNMWCTVCMEQLVCTPCNVCQLVYP